MMEVILKIFSFVVESLHFKIPNNDRMKETIIFRVSIEPSKQRGRQMAESENQKSSQQRNKECDVVTNSTKNIHLPYFCC